MISQPRRYNEAVHKMNIPFPDSLFQKMAIAADKQDRNFVNFVITYLKKCFLERENEEIDTPMKEFLEGENEENEG
jgi:hypothetical protein